MCNETMTIAARTVKRIGDARKSIVICPPKNDAPSTEGHGALIRLSMFMNAQTAMSTTASSLVFLIGFTSKRTASSQDSGPAMSIGARTDQRQMI
jgi:hypothetical protein